MIHHDKQIEKVFDKKRRNSSLVGLKINHKITCIRVDVDMNSHQDLI